MFEDYKDSFMWVALITKRLLIYGLLKKQPGAQPLKSNDKMNDNELEHISKKSVSA
jgi:hypothetical protein